MSNGDKQPSAQMDAVMRVLAGREERTIAEKLADSNRPTWEQYKVDNHDKLNLDTMDESKMAEYRSQLDADRERRMNKSSSKKKKRKKHKRSKGDRKDSDDSSSSDESDESQRHRRKKKKSKRHRKKHRSESKREKETSGDDSSATPKKRKHKKDREVSPDRKDRVG